jgi:modification methylase
VVLDPFFGTGTTGAMARLLGRRWIGIEREAKYIPVAQARIDCVQPAPPETLAVHRRAPRRRLPFGNLLEAGLLLPGQSLYFDRNLAISATILADGHLAHDGFTGSIHQVAAQLAAGQPANGWEHWYYSNGDGSLHAISELRDEISRRDHNES